MAQADLFDEQIEDEAAEHDAESLSYTISWYGADYTVDGLVKRIHEETFFIPPFQRHYVWSRRQASRFIESLLLGLPVPGIFVAKEANSARHMVIDGQQRLKTLYGFYKNEFPKGGDFSLEDVDPKWIGKTYETLDSDDRTKLDDSIIHTTVFKQDEPREDNSSIYHVFQRLNDGGTKLSPQEIRRCLDFGPLITLLDDLNQNEDWREIYGKESPRLKDQEMILRFFALLDRGDKYKRPMKDFLDKYSASERDLSSEKADQMKTTFNEMIAFMRSSLGRRSFRATSTLNAAIFDAVSVAVAKLQQTGKLPSKEEFANQYELLISDSDFEEAYSRATADEQRVEDRLRIALEMLTAKNG